MTLSELQVHTGIRHKGTDRQEYHFDPETITINAVAFLLAKLWNEMNDLCNSIAKALDSD